MLVLHPEILSILRGVPSVEVLEVGEDGTSAGPESLLVLGKKNMGS